MKIFYITTTVHLSKELNDAVGSTTHTYQVARELVKKSHEVHIISKKYASDRKNEIIDDIYVHRLKRGVFISGEKLEKRKIKKYFRPLKIFSNLLLTYKIGKLVETYGCDVILERGHSLGVGAYLSYLTGRPLVLEVIDHIFSRRSQKKAAKIISYTKKFFRKKDLDKIKIVSAGYDPEMFYPEMVENRYDLCYVGSFKEWDGVEDLIEAVNILLSKDMLPGIKLALVGEGARFSAVKKLIKKYRLEENVKLAGNIRLLAVKDYINSAKICVAPYNLGRSDKGRFDEFGFYYSPLKIFEYFACGKPVIATDYKMIRNIISPANGALFSQGDSMDLARKIKDLLKNRDLAEISRNNLAQARKYTWKKVVEDIEKVLKQILSEKRKT